MNEKSLNFKIPELLYSKLKSESEKKGLSLAALIRVILSDYFEIKEK